MAALVTSVNPDFDSYKYQWARYVARRNLEERFQVIKNNFSVPYSSLSSLLVDEQESALEKAGKLPEVAGHFKVGIVGAGCAGLFTALIFDFLNSKFEKDEFHVEYEILEAAGKERLGGRLYTHKFSKDPHDYYDVGAMRFPDNEVMTRTFQLFDFLGMKRNTDGKPLPGQLIPYYLEDYDKVCPSYFNDIQRIGPVNDKDSTTKIKDPYKVNDEKLPIEKQIPADLLSENPSTVIETAIKDLKDALKKDLDDKKHNQDHPDPQNDPDYLNKGWKTLMKADFMSTRQFLRSDQIPDCSFKGRNYNFNTIEWLETFAYATGWYNQSLSETVLEDLDFTVAGSTEKNTKFLCIEGGTQQVAEKMAEKLQQKRPEFNRQVTAIAQKDGIVTLTVKKNDESSKSVEKRDYFAVFNSTTLGALQRMNLKDAGLRYGTKQAIRSLGYGASCKVGIKFKKGWWMNDTHKIKKGGIAKTDLPLRVCVYPSYNKDDDPEKPAVLLCSYTWAQDAQRIGTLVSPTSPDNEEELKALLLENLARLHAVEGTPHNYESMLEELHNLYEDHYSYDWYDDPNMSGAFAYFGPGQFSEMWPEIIQPNDWLFLIGEAASAHHAWIVGALESAVRGVYQMLDTLRLKDKSCKAYQTAISHLMNDKGPFGPLPREIPMRQETTAKKGDISDVPKEGADLNFTAAEILLGLLEAVIEASNQEMKS